MVGTLHFEMCRNVPKRCVVSGVLVSSVLVSYKVLDTEAPMLALPLRLPRPLTKAVARALFASLMDLIRQYAESGVACPST